jgi:ferrous iron transport protein A
MARPDGVHTDELQIDSRHYETCSLDCVRAGDYLEIVSVDDDHARIQAMRFGMSTGACVECITRIPAGPLVIKSGRQEIAVGRTLARRIQVRRRHHGHHRTDN